VIVPNLPDLANALATRWSADSGFTKGMAAIFDKRSIEVALALFILLFRESYGPKGQGG
jgi:hypothetical protein